ncbi:MAG: FxsA family protein, partial [Actinomycetota bacterium]|nr:FxsA family protein [Actinomycetota bacterium]
MPLALLLAFVVVPLVELLVVLRVGEAIGTLPTIVLLLAVSVAGAWLVKREGREAWRRLRAALGSGRLPAAEVVDGALVLIGGTLLLTPGFITDAVGLLLVVPPSRAVVNRAVRARFRGAFTLGVLGASRRRRGRPP